MERGKMRRAFFAAAIVAVAGLPMSVFAAALADDPADEQAQTRAEPEQGERAQGRIRFNFTETPYDQVLNFFARETGLPVIKEAEVPPGSMTFISAADYSFRDALEIFNLNLRMHDRRLVREERFLYLRTLQDAARRPTPVAGPDQLEDIDPSEFLTLYIPLNNAIASTVAEQISPLVRSPGMLKPIDSQNMLILVETAAQCRRIHEIVARIDGVRPADTDFRVFHSRSGPARELARMLRNLVPEREQVMQIDNQGNPRIVDDVSKPPLKIQHDDRLNTVIVVGPTQRMAGVAELVALLDAQGTDDDGSPQLMTFRVDTIGAEQAAQKLQALFRAVPDARRPTIEPLADVGRVMVVGTPNQLVQARALLSELEPAGEGREADEPERAARVVPLEHVQPREVEQISQRMLSPRQQRVLRYAPAPNAQGMIVSGPAPDVDAFERLVRAIDAAPEQRREVRVVRISTGDPREVVARARELDEMSRGERDEPVDAILDDEGRAVTLVGARDAVARFERMLGTAQDKVLVETERRTYRLERTAPADIAGRLSRLARPLLMPDDGAEFVEPSFEPLDDLRTLVVRATPDQFAVIESLIDRLDDERPGSRRIQILPLSGPDPERVVARAMELYERQVEGLPADEAGPVSAEIDRASGKLIVTAAPRAMDRFVQVLRQSQELTPPARTTRMIELEHADAVDVVDALREYLEEADPIDPARAVPDPAIRIVERTNAIMVTAEQSQHDLIAAYIARLDTIEPSELPPLRLLQLRAADANSIASMLNDQYQRRPSADRAARPVEVRSDQATNTLIVSAHEELFADIRGFVEELNREQSEGPERVTVLFTLKVAKAEDVAAAMDRLYPEPPMPRDRLNRPMPWLQQEKEVTVSADPSTNSLIIDAPADRIESLEELARRLDQIELPPVAELRTYRVVGADLNAVAQMLQGLARRGTLAAPAQPGTPQVQVAIETEPLSSTLIVAGDETTFEKIEQILESLTAAPVDRGLRIVPITNASAAEVRDRALAIYDAQVARLPRAGEIEIRADEATNSLEVVADEEAMERVLAILEQLQRQVGPGREVRMIELSLARVDEVIDFLRELVAASESLRVQGGPEPVFEPVRSTNAVLVAAQPSQFPIIEQLIKGVDSRRDAERPPLRILRLRTTEATNIAEILQRSYDQRPVEERTLKPVDIQADAATNTLIVSAHPDVLSELNDIVTELNEAQAMDAEGREIRIFPLRVARAEELARTIDEMYPQPPVPRDRLGRPLPDLQPPREIVVRADRATNSLIVDAPAQRLAGFERIVEALDSTSIDAEAELRTYRIQHAELAAVADTLRRLADSGALASTAQTPITISTEPASRTLIVSGPGEIFERVASVVADVDGEADTPETVIRMYRLQHARADQLKPLIDQLLATRLRDEARREGAPRDAEALLDVAADRGSNTLIISAPESAHRIAEQLIESLDTEAASVGRAVLRVHPLTYADAGEVARAVNQAIPTIELPAGGPVTVIAAAGSNALLLTGAGRDLEALESVIDPLDRQPFDPEKPDIRTFPLRHADARAIAETVERLLVDQQMTDPQILAARLRLTRGAPIEGPSVRVEAEQRTNALIISAPANTLELAGAVIERLDRPAEGPERTAQTFTPARAEPEALTRAVQRVVVETMPADRRPLELFAEPGSGSIVVIGSDGQVGEALRLLAEFDDRAPAMPVVEVRTFELEHADAGALAGTVRTLLSDRSRWPESLTRAERAGVSVPPPALEPDSRTNRLIVSVPGPLMALAAELIETIDSPASQDAVEVRVFRLSKGEAESVAGAVREALGAGLSASEPRPVVSAERGSNTVIVAAGPERLARASELIESMDDTVEPDAVGVRTVFLRHARAETIAPLVERVFAREDVLGLVPAWARVQIIQDATREGRNVAEADVRVVAERRLNALVVSAPAPMLALAEQVIAGLDVDPDDASPMTARSVRVVSLVNADAAELVESIQAVFDEEDGGDPAPVVRVDRASNSLIVRGTPEQHETIAGLARRLDDASLTSRTQLRMIPVDRSRADAEMMARTLKRMLEQQGGVRVEIISAEELLERQQTPRGPQSNAGEGPRAPAGAITPATRFVAAVTGVLVLRDAEPAQSPDDAAPPTITIAVDRASNALVVIGSPSLTDRIAGLAAELERQMPAEPSGVRIVQLPGNVEPQSIAAMINQTVREVGRAGPDNPGGFTGRIAVRPEPDAGALIVWANETDFASVSELIAGVSRLGRADEATVKIYPLSNVAAPQAAEALRDLFAVSPRGRQARQLRQLDLRVEGPDGDETRATLDPNRLTVIPDPSQTALIISAPSEAFDLIDRFIGMLDQSPVSERLAIRRYELENARAADLSTTLQRLFEAQRQGPTARDMPQARFIADDRTNSMLVTASTAQHEEVVRLLETADVALDADGLELAIIPLQRSAPSAVRGIVEQVVIGRDPGRRERIRISAEDRSGVFVVKAAEEELEEIRRIVAEIDRVESDQFPVRSIRLERADAQSVAQSLQQFFRDRARISQQRGGRAASGDAAIIGDRRSGTLLIAASDADYEQIASLVEQFDAPAEARELQFHIIQLEHTTVGDLRQTIQGISQELQWERMGFGWGRGREPAGDQDRLFVELNERANSVVLLGQGETLETMKRIVAELDQPTDGRGETVVRVVRAEGVDIQAVARLLRDTTGTPGWRPWMGRDPDALTVEVDRERRQLLIVGSQSRVDAAVASVEQIVEAGAGEGRVIEPIRLRHAQADRAAQTLQRFFTDRARADGRAQSELAIIGSPEGNVVIVSGDERDMPLVRELIEQIDQPDLGEDRRIEVFALSNASPQETAQTIRQMVPGGRRQEDRVIVTPQPTMGSIIVSAPQQEFGAIRELLDQLDRIPGADRTKIEAVALESARATEVARALREALPENVRVQITAVERTNSLLLTGSEEAIALVRAQIATLDTELDRSPLEFKTFTLEHATVSDVAFTLRAMVRNRPRSPGDPAPSIDPVTAKNLLAVTATPDEMRFIEEMIADLDVAQLTARRTEFVRLEFASAEQAGEALKVFYGRFAPEATTIAERGVTIVPDPASNSLVISADEQVWPGIEKLLETIDTPDYDVSQQLVVIPLRHASATSVARALNEGFRAPLEEQLRRERVRLEAGQQRGRDGQDRMLDRPVLVQMEQTPSVSAEPQSNSLVVFASRREIERIRAIVKQLDVPDILRLPAARIIPLERGRASSVAETVRRVFLGDQDQRSGVASRVLIFGDDASGSIIVRAEDDEFEQIRDLAASLQERAGDAEASPRVIRVSRMPASRLRQTILSTFQPIAQQRGEALSVEIDRQNNALVVASSDRMFRQIEEIVRELDGAIPDGGGPGGFGQGIFIIDVEHSSPEEVKTLLEQLGVTRSQADDRPGLVSEPVTIVPLRSRRSIAVLASPGDGPAIVELVRRLDSAPADPDQQLGIVRLRLAEAGAVVSVLRQVLDTTGQDAPTGAARALAEQIRRLSMNPDRIDDAPIRLDLAKPIRLIADQPSNAVVIASTPDNVRALREIVRTFDTLPVGEAVTVRIFPLDNASARRVKTIIDDLFSRGETLQRLPGTTRRGMPVTTVGRALSGEVAVSVDDRTNALVVAGREEAVALVEVLIGDLDREDAERGWIEAAVVEIEHADAVALADKLNQVLVQGLGDTPEEIGLRRQVGRLRVLVSTDDDRDVRRVESDLFAPMSGLVITAEESLNGLLVIGTPTNIKVVRELVRMLDVEKAAAQHRVRVIPLRFADADRVATIVQDVFRQREGLRTTRPEDRVVVSVDARSNALVVSTSPRSFQVIDSLLESLDRDEIRRAVGIHVIPVEGADVTQLAPRLERLMRERIDASRRSGERGSPMDVFRIEAEPVGNLLIVAASEENLALLKELIEALVSDGAAAISAERMALIPIESPGRAVEIAGVIAELYVEKENRRRGPGSVNVIPNTRQNALLVTGTDADVRAIRGLVAQLDQADVGTIQDVRRIELRSASAREIVELLEGILAGQPISGSRAGVGATRVRIISDKLEEIAAEAVIDGPIRDHVTLTADARTNSVFVKAPPTILELISTIIRDIDLDTRGDRLIEKFRLTNADATQMQTLLAQLFNMTRQGNQMILAPAGRTPDEEVANGALPTGRFTTVPDSRVELSITVDRRTNTLLVSGTREYLDEVRAVVHDLDGIEATERERLVYPLRNAQASEIQETLQAYFAGESDLRRETLGTQLAGSLVRELEREVTIIGDEKSNKLIVAASPRYIEAVRQIIAELDASPPQVMIQVLLAEVTLDSESNWGADINIGGVVAESNIGGDGYVFETLAAGAGVATALGVPNLSVASTDFTLLVRALQVQGRLEVLSRPQVQVNNNESAFIQVGEDISLIESVEQLETRTRAIVQRQSVGIILDVTPSISNDGFVRMEIAPEISSVSNRTTPIDQDFEAPIITQRRVQTTVTVKDGQSVVIGGLIQTSDEQRQTKLPGLGDIPLLGGLFRTNRSSKVKTELLVILTPYVIPGEAVDAEFRQAQLSRNTIGTVSEPTMIFNAIDQSRLAPEVDVPSIFPDPALEPVRIDREHRTRPGPGRTGEPRIDSRFPQRQPVRQQAPDGDTPEDDAPPEQGADDAQDNPS